VEVEWMRAKQQLSRFLDTALRTPELVSSLPTRLPSCAQTFAAMPEKNATYFRSFLVLESDTLR
jgi:hypothetical protein